MYLRYNIIVFWCMWEAERGAKDKVTDVWAYIWNIDTKQLKLTAV